MAEFNRHPIRRGAPPRSPGEVAVPEVREPRCNVCTSQYRKDMEALIVKGLSYSEIARYFEAMGETVNRKNLSNHHQRHMWVEKAAYRRIIEERAKEALMDVDETKGFILTKRALLELMVHKGWEKVLSGESEIPVKDLLAIIEKMEKLEAEEKSVAVDEMMYEFQAFADAVKKIVPEALWKAIFDEFQRRMDERSVQTLESLVVMEEEPPKELGDG